MERISGETGLITDGMQTYRGVHAALKHLLCETNYYQHFLVFILMLCALVTTVRSHHFTSPGSRWLVAAYRIGQSIYVYVLLCFSFWKYREIQAGSIDADLANVWMIGLGLLSTVVFIQAIKSFRDSTFSSADVLAIPLFCVMGLASGSTLSSSRIIRLGSRDGANQCKCKIVFASWALRLDRHAAEAIYADPKVFDVVRPLKLAPELLSIVVVLGAAIPTAYSGASDICHRRRRSYLQRAQGAGAHENLALAATAMSGSMGVVLSPCLLVILLHLR